MIDQVYLLVFFIVVPIIITWFLIDIIRKISIKLKIFSIPNDRSSHDKIVPITGGVALCISWILIISFFNLFNFNNLNLSEIDIYIYSLAGIIMCIVGFYDDLNQMPALMKLCLQLFTFFIITFAQDGLINSFHGVLGIYELSYVQSLLFSGFVFIVILNAINLIDGIDGLSASLTLFFLLNVTYLFYNANHSYYLLTGAFSSSLFVFIFYNFSKNRKIFLGDTGSLGLGIVVSVISLGMLNTNQDFSYLVPINSALFLVLILAYPLLDVIRVFVLRLYNRKSPFNADRNHIHHKIIDLGYTHFQSVIIILFFQASLLLLNIYVINSIGLHNQILVNVVIISLILFFLYKLPNKLVS